ncbi:MAG: YncE family protein [Acidobacteriota bacterium]
MPSRAATHLKAAALLKAMAFLQAGAFFAVAALGLWAAPARASGPEGPLPDHPQIRKLDGEFRDKPSVPPLWTIPVDELGFAAPGPLYLGQRNSLVSLDFLSEDRLLFTFRVPALLHRTPGEDSSDEREIRAVVLSLPEGTLEAESHWLVHDRARYLWMTKDGHFLLRDQNTLFEGDGALHLKPLLKFPGPLLTIEMDPEQNFLLADSREPLAASKPQPDADPGDGSGDDSTGRVPDLVLRILQRSTGQVLTVARVPSLIHLPMNSDGYLSPQRGTGVDWRVMLNFFTGQQRELGTVKSDCMPQMHFVSEQEFLVTACSDAGDDALVAMTTSGEKLWTDLVPDHFVWPNLVMSPDGTKIVRETLYVSHGIDAFSPMGNDDIKGQWVQVLDAATGNVIFDAPANPILDAGGNVAVSPSGQRVAVVNGNAIQVFELPAPRRAPAPVSSR